MLIDLKNTYNKNPLPNLISIEPKFSSGLINDLVIAQMLECFPDLVLILDKNRRIVACNEKARRFFNHTNKIDTIGSKLGEAFGCVHALQDENGCGESEYCFQCGANKGYTDVLNSAGSYENECRIKVDYHGIETVLDFSVYTSNLQLGNNEYIVLAIKNLESEKRRELLERIFYHDVLNTASIIFGISGMISEVYDTDDFEKYATILQNTSEQLIQEIQAQRDLTNAEAGKLVIYPALDNVNDILEKAFQLYQNNSLTKGKDFVCEYPEGTLIIETDHHFIIRSLGNLIKNALEAINPGGKVSLTAKEYGDNVRFVVANDGVIPKHIQLQIFNRSFSTKAKKGRGIGTYSVKLLIENYLKGKVSFVSNDENQTQFIIDVPKRFPEPNPLNL